MTKTESTTTVTKKTITGVRCDGCGRYEKLSESVWSSWVDLPDGWLSFTSGHNDYAEASEERESHDVCSFACYVTVMRKLVAYHTRYSPDMPRTFAADGKDEAFIRALLEAVPESEDAPKGQNVDD